MNIHEYQAKELLKRHGVTVPDGHVAWTSDEAVSAASKLPGPVYVVKSQIHAGGRGAGRFKEDPQGKGGVRVVKSTGDVKTTSGPSTAACTGMSSKAGGGRQLSRFVYLDHSASGAGHRR